MFVINLPCDGPRYHPPFFDAAYQRFSDGPESTFCAVRVPVGELDYEVRVPYCGCYWNAKDMDILDALGEIIGTRFLSRRTFRLPPGARDHFRYYEYGLYDQAMAAAAYHNCWDDFCELFTCDCCGKHPSEDEIDRCFPMAEWGYLNKFFRQISDTTLRVIREYEHITSSRFRCCSATCWTGLAHKLASLLDQLRKDRQCLVNSKKALAKLRKELRQPSPNPDVLRSLRTELRQQTNLPNSCQT
jgi:hypothetical protein